MIVRGGEQLEPKASLRSRLRARRRSMDPARRGEIAEGLRDVVLSRSGVTPGSRVACYLSAPTEPGTEALRAALRALPCEVLLPVVAGEVLDWAVDDGTQVRGPLGVPEPPGPRLGPHALAGCGLVLVPALAADVTGTRLGQGGGYYDRTLARVRPAGPVVALVHDEELAGPRTLPRLAHDVTVDAVATPSRWVRVSRAAPAAGGSARARRPPGPPPG